MCWGRAGDQRPWEEAHTSELPPPVAAFKLKHKNGNKTQHPYPELKCAGGGKREAAEEEVPSDCNWWVSQS